MTITLGASLSDTFRAAIFSVSLFPLRWGRALDFESGTCAIAVALETRCGDAWSLGFQASYGTGLLF
jgi:hypothetical protein